MKVLINKKAVHRILQGHPWIFRSDLVSIEAEQAGVAQVFSPQNKLLGEALYSPQSLIALRMMTRAPEKLDEKLIKQRILAANQKRREYFPNSKIYRMVFGEADALPSLIIDRFSQVLVFQTLSSGMEVFKEAIIKLLQEEFNPISLVERNDATVRQKENLPLIQQICSGDNRSEVEIEINGTKFLIDPLAGQKTGFFLDQRFNALQAANFLRGEILDAFCNQGQFALQAAALADQITCVDLSNPVLERLKKNAQLNESDNIQTIEANVFDFLKSQVDAKKTYDGIVLDPPAFVKSRSSLKNAMRGYKEINLRAMRLLRQGGILVTSSCSQNLSHQEFEEVLRSAAIDARRRIQVLAVWGQPADHAWLLSIPETRYLKCYVLKVAD